MAGAADQHVVENRERRECPRELKRPNQTQAGNCLRPPPGNNPAVVNDATRIELAKPSDQVEHGRLSGAVGSDQGGDRASGNGEACAIDGRDSAEGLGDLVDGQSRSIVLTHLRSTISSRRPVTPCGRQTASAMRIVPTSMNRRAATCEADRGRLIVWVAWSRNSTTTAPINTPR